jgi:hypothetical protein
VQARHQVADLAQDRVVLRERVLRRVDVRAVLRDAVLGLRQRERLRRTDRIVGRRGDALARRDLLLRARQRGLLLVDRVDAAVVDLSGADAHG